jgi:exodeoxyribonuclease VII large subunit
MAELVHPERPLSKGYVRVTSRDGRTLTRSADARAAGRLTLHFGDGPVDAAVDTAPSLQPVERKRSKPYIASQPGLFDPAED